MKFTDAIDLYLADMRSEGRITSDSTVRTYRFTLEAHAESAGLLVAQVVLGHASVETTRSTYVDRVSLDDLAAATADVTYHPQLSPDEEAVLPRKAPTGIEPVQPDSRPVSTDRSDLGRLLVQLREAFTGITFDEAAA